MFRFLLGFIYVLYTLIELSKSSSVLASFNESCSNNISCANPLICSNTSRCICSQSSSFWDNEQNDCLYCLPGWIDWENNHCLSFAIPSEGGLSYDQAKDTCYSFSAELFHIYNRDQFEQFQLKVNTLLQSTFSKAVTLFFRLGAWIEKLNIKGLEDIWCNENEDNSTFECVSIKKKSLQNHSLCLSRLQCNKEMLFICDMPVMSEKNTTDNENSISSNQRFASFLTALAPVALQVLGNLINPNQAQPTPATPQHIIIQQETAPPAQDLLSDDVLLYVGLGIGAIVLLLIICGAAVAVIQLTGCMKNSSSTQQTNDQRSSIESDYSYG